MLRKYVIVGLGFVLLIAFLLMKMVQSYRINQVNSFQDCQNLGYPIAESYPAKCYLPNGKSFTQELPSPNSNHENAACTLEAKLCPDGSYVGRVPPNCEFEKCSE